MTPEQRKQIKDAARRKLHPPLPFLDDLNMNDEIRRILRAPQDNWSSPTINAIKYVRNLTGWFLVECKSYVEAVRDSTPLPDTRNWYTKKAL